MLDEETMEANTTRFKERYSEYREYGCLLKVSEGQLSAVMNEIEKLTDKLAGYEQSDRYLSEVLNTGDGTYKP